MRYSQEDILQKIKTVLHEQFEIDIAKVTLEADLREDLDIDSIDAVDLMIELKSLTMRKLSLEDFQDVKTVGNLVDVVHRISQEDADANGSS